MNLMMCERYGHTIVALANLLPAADTTEELDSFMYQTVRTNTSAGLRTGCIGYLYNTPTQLYCCREPFAVATLKPGGLSSKKLAQAPLGPCAV
jgi:hypothetical protein